MTAPKDKLGTLDELAGECARWRERGETVVLVNGAFDMLHVGHLRYLAGAYGKDPFWPADARRRAELDMWAEWTKGSFCTAFANDIFWPLMT